MAATLAWAVTHRIAFSDALLSLTIHGVPLSSPSFFRFFHYRNWDYCLQAAVLDLTEGKPLSQALCRLRYFLPDYYLIAVKEAEKNGTLEQTLPAFADCLRFSAGLRRGYWKNISYPLVELYVIAPIIIGMCTFIMPKWNRIMAELLGHQSVYPNWFVTLAGYGQQIVAIAIIGGILYLLLRRFRWELLSLLEEFLRFVPGWRREFKTVAMMELASAMRACLNSGMDTVAAIHFCRQSCRHLWLQRRLIKCARQLDAGVPFLTAWQKTIAVHDPIPEFLIGSSLAVGNPAAGFSAMIEWNAERAEQAMRYNSTWLMLLLLVFNITLVGGIIFFVFSRLIMIIEHLVNTI